MRLSLRAGEKIYINGAVFSVDRRVSLQLLNDVTFLLESHVMQPEQATTPLRQIYFAIQMTLMDPGVFEQTRTSIYRMLDALLRSEFETSRRSNMQDICMLMETGRCFDALRIARDLYRSEEARQQAEKSDDRGSISQCK